MKLFEVEQICPRITPRQLNLFLVKSEIDPLLNFLKSDAVENLLTICS